MGTASARAWLGAGAFALALSLPVAAAVAAVVPRSNEDGAVVFAGIPPPTPPPVRPAFFSVALGPFPVTGSNGPSGKEVTYFTGGTLGLNLAVGGVTQALGPGNGVVNYAGGGVAPNAIPVPTGTASMLRIRISGAASANPEAYPNDGFTFVVMNGADGTVTCEAEGLAKACVTPSGSQQAFVAGQKLWIKVTGTANAATNVTANWSLRYEVQSP